METPPTSRRVTTRMKLASSVSRPRTRRRKLSCSTCDGEDVPDTLGGEGYGVLNRSRTKRAPAASSPSSSTGGRSAPARTTGPGLQPRPQPNPLRQLDRARRAQRRTQRRRARTGHRSARWLDHSRLADRTDALHRLFLSERLPIADKLAIEIGLRWNHARIILDDRIGTALDGSHRFRRLNPGIELEWRISPAVTVRAGYAETNRAPTPGRTRLRRRRCPVQPDQFLRRRSRR